jgi:hypothetical protein
MAEVAEGDAGQDKVFWHDVAEDFNDYKSKDNDSDGALVITWSTDVEIFSRKNIDSSKQSSTLKTWKDLHDMHLAIQRDNKKKFERLKMSRNHDSNFHNFVGGQLDTYYMHVLLNIRDNNMLETIMGNLPDEACFESLLLPQALGSTRATAQIDTNIEPSVDSKLPSDICFSSKCKQSAAAELLQDDLSWKQEGNSATDALKY